MRMKEEDETLVEMQKTGLHTHPALGYIAASPDALGEDSSVTPSSGLLEIKFIASVNGPPANAIPKAGYCVERREGRVHLKRKHKSI